MEARLRQEQSDEHEDIDDRCADIGRSRHVGTTEAFGRGPDHKSEQDAARIGDIAEHAEDKCNRERRFGPGDNEREDVRIDLDDVDPESDPGPNQRGLPLEPSRQVTDEARLEGGLPFECGVYRPYQSEGNAPHADGVPSPRLTYSRRCAEVVRRIPTGGAGVFLGRYADCRWHGWTS